MLGAVPVAPLFPGPCSREAFLHTFFPGVLRRALAFCRAVFAGGACETRRGLNAATGSAHGLRVSLGTAAGQTKLYIPPLGGFHRMV